MNDYYDEDDYISPEELDETKALASQVLEYLNKCKKDDEALMDSDDTKIGIRTQREILDHVGREHIRFWEPAISSLMDYVERIDKGLITRYRRRDIRRAFMENGSNQELYAKTPPRDMTTPWMAWRGKK